MSVFRRPSSGVPAGDAIPFWYEGVTHLFFLSSPPDTTDYPARVRTTWRHARSRDLVDWEELPPAVEPGDPGSVDGDGVWTGSVVEHGGTFFLFYTGHRVGATNPQTICLATSTDLVTFHKDPHNPILVPTPGFEPIDWRDPYVFFNASEGRWWMLIAGRLASGPRWHRGCLILATSTDLRRWDVEPEPFFVPGDTWCPECPELWPLDGRWALVYSRFSELAGTIVRVAETPRGPFRVPADDALGGRRWYAAKSAPTADGAGRAFFGWIHDQAASGRWYWGGDFAAPREVVSSPEGGFQVRLPAAVEDAFRVPVPVDGGPAAMIRLDGIGSTAAHRLLPAVLPAPYLARFRFRLGDAVADAVAELPAAFGVMLRTDDDLGGWYVTVDRVRGSVHLARQPHPLDDFWADLVGRAGEVRGIDGPIVAEARLPADAFMPGGEVTLQLLVEGPLLEVYVADRVVLTHRISEGGHELGLFVRDGALTCEVSVRSG